MKYLLIPFMTLVHAAFRNSRQKGSGKLDGKILAAVNAYCPEALFHYPFKVPAPNPVFHFIK